MIGGASQRPTRGLVAVLSLCAVTAACAAVAPITPPAASPKPGPSARTVPRIVHVPLSACAPFFAANVSVGGQSFRLLVDTGSTTTAVASASCSNCGPVGTSGGYQPGPNVPRSQTTASTTYGGGSGKGWSGPVLEDSVSLDGLSVAPSVKLVAIESQSGILNVCEGSGTRHQGILGLGPTFGAMPGTNGFLDQLRATGSVPDVFAIELCPFSAARGHLWLGGFDPSYATAAPSYTPMTERGLVQMSDLSVGGASVGLPDGAYGDVLVDSGSPVTQLPSPVFAALTAAIESSASFKTLLGNDPGWSIWHGCAPIPLSFAEAKAQFDALLPPLAITFGKAPSSITIRAPASESYLRPAIRHGKTMWCSGIVEAKGKPDFIVLGSPIMEANITIFDRQNRRVGFAPPKPCE